MASAVGVGPRFRVCYFFFSSRRRHTRLQGDWSSDVCSSDLVEKAGAGDPVPEIGVNRDFEEAVGSLKKGEVSQPVAAPGERMIIAVITDVFPEIGRAHV